MDLAKTSLETPSNCRWTLQSVGIKNKKCKKIMPSTYFFPPGSGDNPLFSLYLEPKLGAVMPCLIENPVTGNTLCRCHP